jgi:tRNA threonylcarbamoyladenosine biosynthesis protein TsaE
MAPTFTVSARDAGETRAVGAALAELLAPGDVVALTGELGAGKTTFVQGAAGALGVTDPVSSPTFVLVRNHEGRVPVAHVDVYRLERIQEVLDLGFDELLDGGSVVFVEWGDAIEALLPESHLVVSLSLDPDGGPEGVEPRTISVTGHGPAWAPRWERLEGLLGSWRAA